MFSTPERRFRREHGESVMRILNVESLARDCKEPVEMRWVSRDPSVESDVQQVVQRCKVVRAQVRRPHGRTARISDIAAVGTRSQYISLPAACVAPRYQTQYLRPNPSATNPRLLQLRDLSLHVLESPRRCRRAPLKPKRRGDLLRAECPERLE